MTLVIGFVTLSRLESLNKDIKLPIGFDANGEVIHENLSTSRLLLLDDDSYADVCVRGDGQCPALVVQHIGSSARWSQQDCWLFEMGWKPVRIDEFHQGGDYAFWKDVQGLLTLGTPHERATLLENMAARYDVAQTFRLLDVWAAYAILADLCDDADFEDKRASNFRALPQPISAELGNIRGLGPKLAKAEEIAGKLPLG